ncbi:alpha/beta fold hydrolase [Pseudoscardovia radai]|uniref:alpha/beta fold hydrolase n=1 Tax=Pseudoscardovia radai TaxID=987066 RepID=UPI0039969FCF
MTYLTTKNEVIAVHGEKIAYRELSKGKSEFPLVMLVHLAANMDNWDPQLIDLLAEHQHLILLDLPGVGASEGKIEPTLEETAESVVAIVHALGYEKINLLGLSMGGTIAQEVVRAEPELVHKLILVGIGPRGGKGIDRITPVTFAHMFHALLQRKDMKRYIFYTNDTRGEQEATKVFNRLNSRTSEWADQPMKVSSFLRQLRAIKKWGTAQTYDLTFIKQPTLIVNGDQDDMVPTENSYQMHEKIEGSQLIIYPHAGHGSLFQYAGAFSQAVQQFLA